jgi:antitoxin component of MazEF toxin-antitoxin module
MATEVEVRKWGNSMGVILPKELIAAEELQQHDRILIDVVKRADLTDVFGSFRTKKSGQQFKNMVRKGWQR